MSFKQINQLEQYMNPDTMLSAYTRGGKYFLLTKGGEIEIDSTTYGALTSGLTAINSVYHIGNVFARGISKDGAYKLEFKNGMQIDVDSTEFSAITGSGFYALGGVYYNRDNIVCAYSQDSGKYAALVNGAVIKLADAEWTAITSATTYFASINAGNTIYFNKGKFIRLTSELGKYYIELDKGVRVEITQSVFNTLKGDLTAVGGAYYVDTNQIVRGESSGTPEEVKITNAGAELGTFTVTLATYKSATSSSTEQKTFSYVLGNIAGFNSAQQTGTTVYFNTYKTAAQIKALIDDFAYDETTHKIAILGTQLYAYKIDTDDYALGFEASGTTTYVYATKAFTPAGGTEITAGWHNLTSGAYTITSELGVTVSPNDYNGKLISPSNFASAYSWQLGGSNVTLATYGIAYAGSAVDGSTFKSQYFTSSFEGQIHFNNGIILPVSSAAYNAVTNGFHAVNGIKYNDCLINKVFSVGGKYIAEFKSGYQVELTTANKATEYAAFKPYTITATLSHVTASASNPTTIEPGGSATLTYTAETGYSLPASVTVTGATGTWTQGTGTLALANATGNVTFSITGVQ